MYATMGIVLYRAAALLKFVDFFQARPLRGVAVRPGAITMSDWSQAAVASS